VSPVKGGKTGDGKAEEGEKKKTQAGPSAKESARRRIKEVQKTGGESREKISRSRPEKKA